MSPLNTATLLVAYLCFAYAAPLTEEVDTAAVPLADVDYRLPLTIFPVNYKITLKPYLNESDPKAFTFDGDCYIEIVPRNNTKQIQLHMKNLEVSLSEYYKNDTPTVKKTLVKATPNELTDIVVYNLDEELKAGEAYVLHFVYVGQMADDMGGFYRSSYNTSKNVTK